MLWVNGQRRLVEEARIKLRCEGRVEFSYVEGKKEGFQTGGTV